MTSPSTVVVTAEVRLIMAECTMLYTSALTEVKATIHSTPFECSGKYSTKRPDYGGGEFWFDGKLIRKDGKFVIKALEPLN